MIRTFAWCALLTATATMAQNPVAQNVAALAPTYEMVSTVKPNHSGESTLRIRMDAGVIFIQNATVRDLLSNTYGMRDSLILDLPKWAESDRYDIQAKVLSDDPNFLQHMTRVQRRQIFEKLLSERFGVAVHRETRISPVYELTKTGSGPQLVENPPSSSTAGPEPIKPGHNGRGNTAVLGTHLDATGVRIGDLCANLARILDRSVIDKTGLTSFYDMTLNWSDEHTEAGSDDAQSAGPPLFTALQEQLGLKLIPSKGPVDVLVVDHASLPKEIDQ